MVVRKTLDEVLKLMQTEPAMSLYARSGGGHVHADINCLMLEGDQFELLGYGVISPDEAKRRKLIPCVCVEERLGR